MLDWTSLIPAWGRQLLRELYAPSVRYTPRLFDRISADLEHPNRAASRLAERLCRAAEPGALAAARDMDAVVATYPLAGRTLGALRADGRLGVPALSFLTDPAAHRTWCHPGLDEHLTVTAATAAHGRRYGVAMRAVGPLCAPRFSRPKPRATRERVRGELGVPSQVPLALLASGRLNAMLAVASAVASAVAAGAAVVAQQRAAHLLGGADHRLLRSPWWLAGTGASVVAVGLQAAALSSGPLGMVQALLAGAIAWAAIGEAAIARRCWPAACHLPPPCWAWRSPWPARVPWPSSFTRRPPPIQEARTPRSRSGPPWRRWQCS